MSKMKLRQRIPTSYFEPEEPTFDEYVYCEKCGDQVFEYCSIHGPLLVVPDSHIPKTSHLPSVPRSALTIPNTFLHIAPSSIPGAGLGVFSTLTLPNGVRFGPYRGKETREITSAYCWQLHDDNRKRTHAIDASDPDNSNWMRYVNCSRHWSEQNLVAFQYQGQMYYRTVKIIPKFTELLVFYGSEFATALNIDLRRYELPEFYPQVIHRNTRKVTENPAETTNSNTNIAEHFINDTETFGDFEIPIQNFVFIDTPETDINLPELKIRRKYTCPVCDNTYTRLFALKKHCLTHANNKIFGIFDSKYVCEICLYPFENKTYLARHVIKKHGKSPSVTNVDE